MIYRHLAAHLATVSLFVLNSGCSSPSKAPAPTGNSSVASSSGPNASATSGRVKALVLKEEEALIRSRQIGKVSYGLWFGLNEVREDYEGRTVIQFYLHDKVENLSPEVFVDFEGGRVRSVTLNGIALSESKIRERYDGNRLHFPVKELKVGSNRIQIAFSHDYSHNGNGLHRFKDPVDGQVYLYSNFEPFNARRMFPCFDQPDLKASYELTVEAPEDWDVIANTEEREVTGVDGRKSWQFPPSPVFSTYVFALHAGPYASWKSDAHGIPLRLFARQSLAQFVDPKEWFEITSQGLEFYNRKFGYPYPFAKYDQVIVPDFNAGAMENVGAVTFSERMVYRSKVTEDTRRRRADTILHEMAHMWFGDLVTMKWWNGLWLNESFATFMAGWATQDATRFKSSWQSFFAGSKQWAYWEDQLVTTHPIETKVADTDQAFASFDGITYGKGASVLKQLMFYLGEADFLRGVNQYFQDYSFRNSRLEDFIRSLAKASGKDLSTWQKSWMQSASLNTVEAVWDCAEGKISKFSLIQKGSEINPELRAHRTRVAFFSPASGGVLKAVHSIDVSYSAADTPVPDALGKACPALVFPNAEDYDYAKVVLDPKSLETVKSGLGSVADPFARQMLWHTLWEMVRDAKLATQDYIDIVLAQSPREKSTQVLSKVLQSLSRPGAGSATALKYLPTALRDPQQARIEEFLEKNRIHAEPGSDLQLIWHQSYVSALRNPIGLEKLRSLLEGHSSLPGLKIDQERRWEILQALARNNAPGVLDLVRAEGIKDATDMGHKEEISAEASIPLPEIKQLWLARILKRSPLPALTWPDPGALPAGESKPTLAHPNPEPASLKLAELRRAMGSFHVFGQEAVSAVTTEIYFNELPRIASTEDEEFVSSFAGAMFPPACEPKVVELARHALKSHPEFPAAVIKDLKLETQETERCIRAQSVARLKADEKKT